MRIGIAPELKRDGPLAVIDFRIPDGGLIGDGVGIHGREALHHLLFVAMEIGSRIEPGLVVEIGGIHHQRIAFPVSDRIALRQLDLGVDMRTPIHRDDAVAVHELPKHDDITARLQQMKSELRPDLMGHAGLRAMRLRLLIHMVKLQVLLLRAGPTLIRDLAVRWIDDDALAAEKRERSGMLLNAIHRARNLRYPIAFEIRLAVGRVLDGTRLVRSTLAVHENALSISAATNRQKANRKTHSYWHSNSIRRAFFAVLSCSGTRIIQGCVNVFGSSIVAS